jgi:hypothetical protein
MPLRFRSLAQSSTTALSGFDRSFRLMLVLASVLFPLLGNAHVGSPHIVFQGKAGLFPVTAVVRQPDVVPGLVDIHIRVHEGAPTQVTALAMHSTTGRKGAPRPDLARPVEGETNLYSAQLWFMTRGAYGVEVMVDGEGGGALMVPVNSVALERRPMPVWLVGIASALLLFLAIGVISICVAAVRESTLPAVTPVLLSGRRLRSWIGGVLGLTVVVGAVFGARLWWNYEDELHQSKVLFRPLQHTLAVETSASGSQLRLELTDRRMSQRNYRLLPDHGKWVHLFLVGAGDRPAFAHLHPVRDTNAHTFVSLLPNLPAGEYRVFADLTHEQGLTQTLTNRVRIEEGVAVTGKLTDPDDSWSESQAAEEGTCVLGPGLRMTLQPTAPLRVGQPIGLEAAVATDSGDKVTLEPYLRMLGHAVVMRADAAVFSHVHPAGTLSMAAARKFAAKDGGEEAARATDAICGDLDALPEAQAIAMGRLGKVSFPYVFPSAGEYRIWVQVKVQGRIVSGTFKVQVEA